MIITLKHMRSFPIPGRKNGYCSRGAREFANHYGLDWADFVKNGIDETELLKTGDAMAKKIVDWVKSNA